MRPLPLDPPPARRSTLRRCLALAATGARSSSTTTSHSTRHGQRRWGRGERLGKRHLGLRPACSIPAGTAAAALPSWYSLTHKERD